MTRLKIVGGSFILPDSIETDWQMCLVDGRIESLGPAAQARTQIASPILDAAGKYVVPGFIDMHVHGGAAADFMDGTPEAFRTAAKAHLRHGTTTIFPTTTTGSAEQIRAALAACRVVQGEEDLPEIPGVHLYGPYFAPDKVGCHTLAGCRPPEPDEYRAYFESGLVRIATCAAELPRAHEFYQAAHQAKCFITCGHSNASWPETQAAFDLGVRHVDHFWCAMSSVPSLRQRFGTPMQASMAEFVLSQQAMSTEVIADGCHLSRELLEFAYQMLGAERLCLVTDCNRALDLPPGRYRFGNSSDGSWFRSDGSVGWADDGSSLASSVRGMDHMLRVMQQQTSATLPEVVRMASLTPAERTGISERKGSLDVGKDADILILTPELSVETVILRGRQIETIRPISEQADA